MTFIYSVLFMFGTLKINYTYNLEMYSIPFYDLVEIGDITLTCFRKITELPPAEILIRMNYSSVCLCFSLSANLMWEIAWLKTHCCQKLRQLISYLCNLGANVSNVSRVSNLLYSNPHSKTDHPNSRALWPICKCKYFFKLWFI